tara:strand:- start:2488 stop:2967 length:480 start_codon:yes stop_codon:yes gene_type:complete
MATYTDAFGFDKGTTASFPDKGMSKISMVEVDMNLATITAARVTAGATALAGGDILQALLIPAKTYVLAAGIDVTTAEGATQTIDLGDGADADGYLDGVNGNAAASYASALALAEGTPNTIVGFSNGKYYSAADTIDVVFVNAADTMVMRVWAVVVDCG